MIIIIRFLYPDAFETFLSFGDQQLQSQAIILLKEKRREKEIEDERKKAEREAINNKTLKPIKTKPKPQQTTRRSTERITTGGPDGAKIGSALEESNYKYIIVEAGDIVDKYDGR